MARLKVHAALHNHAGLYGAGFEPPAKTDSNAGWASGAQFVGPDGKVLSQMPSSKDKADSREYVLVHNVPLPGEAGKEAGTARGPQR